jgi:hypothetical protein
MAAVRQEPLLVRVSPTELGFEGTSVRARIAAELRLNALKRSSTLMTLSSVGVRLRKLMPRLSNARGTVMRVGQASDWRRKRVQSATAGMATTTCPRKPKLADVC